MKHIINLHFNDVVKLHDQYLDVYENLANHSSDFLIALKSALNNLRESRVVQPNFANELSISLSSFIDELKTLQADADRLSNWHIHCSIAQDYMYSYCDNDSLCDCQAIINTNLDICNRSNSKCITKAYNKTVKNDDVFKCVVDHIERCCISPTDDDIDPHNWAAFAAGIQEGLEQIERGECISAEEMKAEMQSIIDLAYNCQQINKV